MIRSRHACAVAALTLALAGGCGRESSGDGGDGQTGCTAPLAECGSSCVDLATDAANCGACGNACQAWESCAASACVAPACLAGTVRCGASCVDLLTDAANCGGCGRACQTACTLGACAGSACAILGLGGPPAADAGPGALVVAADLDGAPGADVAVATFAATGTGELRVFRGVGNGALVRGTSVPIPALAAAIAAGQVNPSADSSRDLAVAVHAAAEGVRLYLGDGSGGFAEAAPANAGQVGPSPQALALLDVDGDGIADLVVGMHPDGAALPDDPNVRILLNDGSGTFGAGTDAPPRPASLAVQVGGSADASPVAFAAADFDGNGAVDVAVAHASGVGVIFRAPNGAIAGVTEIPTPRPPAGLVAVDLDGDGWVDLVAADPDGNGIFVLFKTATPLDRTFQAPMTFATGVHPRAVVAANLDGDPDGRPDIATADAGGGTVTVLRNLYVGGTLTLQPVTVAAGIGPTALAAAPVNGDGVPDLVVLDAGENATVLLADGAGGFVAPRIYPGTGAANALALLDANEDLHLDVAAVDTGSGLLTVRPGNGDGTLGAASSYALAASSAPVAVASADLDGDGHADLVVALQGTGKIAVLWGDGAGAFSAPDLLDGPPVDGLVDVAVADLGDAAGLDVVAAASGSGQVIVFRASGARTFAAPAAVSAGGGPASVAVGRLDGDALDDVVVALPAAGRVAVLLRDPASPGQLRAPVPYDAAPGAAAIAIADLDGDGHPDVAVASPTTGVVAVLLNDGAGALGAGATFPACPGASSVAARDLTGDGVRELVVACPTRGTTAVLRGLGGGAFGPPLHHPTSAEPVRVAAGDLDGAGAADVVSANVSPGALGGIAVQLSACLP